MKLCWFLAFDPSPRRNIYLYKNNPHGCASQKLKKNIIIINSIYSQQSSKEYRLDDALIVLNTWIFFFLFTALLITTVQLRQPVILMVSTNASVKNSDQCLNSCC
jgi:hypothetical protein